ncbi:MAG: exosortase K [Oscillospiraceae bacterium]|nr:exosortase K [Oscillospiraceae bacterium]
MKFRSFTVCLPYLLCAALAGTAYIFLSGHTQWTLLPHTKVLNFLFGLHFYYNGEFYEAVGNNIAITKTCSGVNLFVSLYAILFYVFSRYFTGVKKRVIASPVCFAGAIIIAFAATMIRIIVSLPFAGSPHFKLIHTVISLCVFFGTGLLAYLAAQKLLSLRNNTALINVPCKLLGRL